MSIIQSNVLDRYSEAAREKSAELCCPIGYDTNLLEVLPKEIIEKDYGCGDPSRYVKAGEAVLDLGSGGGKICYIAAQLTGPKGSIVGVDMNDEMLQLARKYQVEIADKLGYDCVEFKKGYIQDLALDLDAAEQYLTENPIRKVADQQRFQQWQQEQRLERPLIADHSIDLVLSNCVLNLVNDSEKKKLIGEIFRVVKPGGRIAISDIVCDEAIPSSMKKDEHLWTGCVSGAFQEREFLNVVAEAGFVGVSYDQWNNDPWQVIEGIEFRSVTLIAYKPEAQGAVDAGHAVIYQGPYTQIHDDFGNFYPRGQRIAVSEQIFQILTGNPAFKNDFIGIAPSTQKTPVPWYLPPGSPRPVSETKSADRSGSSGATPSRCC